MRKLLLVASTCLLASASPAVAQAGSAAMDVLNADVATVERKLIGLAEAIPAESYDWRPGEGVRSVGEVFLHVAADNYFIPIGVGVPAPAATGIEGDDYGTVQAYESRALTKAEVVEALTASFEHFRAAMAAVEAADLMGEVEFFGRPIRELDLWVSSTTHLHEHLGQAIAYARTVGTVPPWSR